MGYFSNGGGSDIFGFLLLCGFLISVVINKMLEGQTPKKVSTITPKKKSTYNGLEVKTISSGKYIGKKYTVNSDGTFNSSLPTNAVISQKTKKELELDKMTKIISEQKKEREHKKRLKNMEKKKVITPALNKSITLEALRLLREKRLNEVRRQTKDKIESENSKVITPEYIKLLRERRLKEILKKEKARKIESANSRVLTPEYIKLLRERRLKETIKKEKASKEKAIEDLLKPFKH